MSLVLLEQEDREFLRNLDVIPPTFRGPIPDVISSADWHRKENQGPMGSCRGNSGTSCLERVRFVRTKTREQLSRIFFYLATQRLDGLLGGDRGSTISNGFKVMLEYGCPTEDRTGYPSSYPDSNQRSAILSQANYAAGEPFKALTVRKVPTEFDEVCAVVAGGGAIDFGIPWPGLGRDRVFRFTGKGGGHANCILGYDRPRGGYEAWNSHGDGLYFMPHEEYLKMLRHSYTASGVVFGQTEPEFVNWTEGYL